MAWSEWKKFGSSHSVIPLSCTYITTSPILDRTFSNVWTNDTGKDVTLYYKGYISVGGNAGSILLRFKTSDGTVLHDVTTFGNMAFNFTVPNGATLELLGLQNLIMGGVLVDYDFTPNMALEE